jgi:broad specificity phosphatase PhoE
LGSLHLVRHGQASFGAANYDQLSTLGQAQCKALGRHWAERGQTFAAVFTGSLMRHRQSLAAIAEALPGLPAAQERPGLNEYDSEALVRALHPGDLPPPSTPEAYRQHFRLLRQALAAWMAGEIAPAGMPSWTQWQADIAAVLVEVRSGFHGQQVLVVSSGGPISTAAAQVLQAPPATVIELNLRLRNSALCETVFTPKRHSLFSFNTLPHLEQLAAEERERWITFT